GSHLRSLRHCDETQSLHYPQPQICAKGADAEHCVAAHSLMGKMAGLSQDELRLTLAGEATGNSQRDALIQFSRLLVSTSGTVEASAVEAVRAAGYSDRQLLEIALAITAITFTNLVNRINDTTVDFPKVV
ncbi:carboxymuconolactone decarboxylase family protein, partial [Aquamicrobium terrae]|uniref:carboxymuconolactone decarboxylase family protein n=1 Tax=Aquamicrobium terrae TaxID=1324945 RepID=UPI003F49AAD6